MAKAAKKKPDTKQAGAKKGTPRKKGSEQTEPLSTFQEPKTGRTDPSIFPDKLKPSNGIGMTVEKVKLVKGESLIVSFSKIEADATTSNDSYENKMRPVHPDCRNAFKALAIHLGLLCDYISTQQVKDISKYSTDLVDKFIVTGVSIGGADEERGIVLTGRKVTKSGKHVILNSPFTRLEEAEGTAYRYVDDLNEKVQTVIEEAKAYMAGKRGEDPQGTLEFPEDNAEEEK